MQKTTNYGIFSFSHDNRDVSEKHVKTLVKSIREIGYIDANPIIVDAAMTIIDGQHRFEACKILSLPICYVIMNSDVKDAMVKLNATQSNWKLSDYARHYAKRGVKCYQLLIEFMEEYKLGDSSSIAILCKLGGGSIAFLRDGRIFDVNPQAKDIVDFLYYCKVYFHFWNSQHFVRAVIAVFNALDKDGIDRIKKEVPSMRQMASTAAYLAVFENMHNRRLGTARRITLTINK